MGPGKLDRSAPRGTQPKLKVMQKIALIAVCLSAALIANAKGDNSAYRTYLHALQQAKASEAKLEQGQNAAMSKTGKATSFQEARHVMVAETSSEMRQWQAIVARLKAITPPPDCAHVHGEILRCFSSDVVMAKNISRGLAAAKSPDDWAGPLEQLKAAADKERAWRKSIDRELAQIFSRHNLQPVRFSPGKS